MRRALLLIYALLALSPGTEAETGAARRVASLNLTSDEILVEILPLDRLVGVTRWADDVETSNVAGRIPPSIYRFPKADMERLVALRPDLVIVSEYHDADFLRLFDKSGLHYHRMSGLDSFRHMRALAPRLRVLFASGHAADCLDGVTSDPLVGFLPKPYRPEHLAKGVREMLDRR